MALPSHAAWLHAMRWASGTLSQLLQRQVHYTSLVYVVDSRADLGQLTWEDGQ